VPYSFAPFANEWVTGIIGAQGGKSQEGSDCGIPPFEKRRVVHLAYQQQGDARDAEAGRDEARKSFTGCLRIEDLHVSELRHLTGSSLAHSIFAGGVLMQQEFVRGDVSVRMPEHNKVRIAIGKERVLDLDLAELNDLIEAGSELRALIAKDRKLAQRAS
jgi:hypothetical protein